MTRLRLNLGSKMGISPISHLPASEIQIFLSRTVAHITVTQLDTLSHQSRQPIVGYELDLDLTLVVAVVMAVPI